MRTYYPAKEQHVAAGADNFDTLLTAAPATYGLLAADATAVHGVVDP